MAILAECPYCHRKQTVKAKVCKGCGEDLDKAKKAKKVKFYISYYLPGSRTPRRECVGTSIQEARDAEGKRRSQKRENRIFDIKPDIKITFNQLKEWYLNLDPIKSKPGFWRIKIALNKVADVLGNMILNEIKPIDLQGYQVKRKSEGFADKTIDDEIGEARAMIETAFYNDKVSGDTLKVFKNKKQVRKLLKRGANTRRRVLTTEEFQNLFTQAPDHLRSILATAFLTGMRFGEIVNLTWDRVDLENRLILLESDNTKEAKFKLVPIGNMLFPIIESLPRETDNPYVFLYNGKPVASVRRSLRQACKRAGIIYGRKMKGGFTFHDLRHTHNTMARKAKVARSVRMALHGHSTEEMDRRYDKVDLEDLRHAVDQFEKYLQSSDQSNDQISIH